MREENFLELEKERSLEKALFKNEKPKKDIYLCRMKNDID